MRNFKSRASKTMAIISVNTTQTGRHHIKQKQLLSNHKGCHATCQPMSWRVNLTTQQHKFDYKSEREREKNEGPSSSFETTIKSSKLLDKKTERNPPNENGKSHDFYGKQHYFFF